MKATILTYLSEQKEKKDSIEKIKNKLQNLNIEIVNNENIEQAISQSDIIITIGGDGTIIRASKYAVKYDKPIVTINLGHIGFIAGIEIDELDLLDNLISGHYTETRHSMLDICIDTEKCHEKFIALNEVSITRHTSTNILDIDITSSDKNNMRYRADGIILSTSTGSTAYSMSAGGPIIDPSLDCMVLTPVCPHSLFSRSVVFGPSSKISMSVSRCSHLSVDGHTHLEISENDKIHVKLSNKSVRLINLKNRDFYQIVIKKLSNL